MEFVTNGKSARPRASQFAPTPQSLGTDLVKAITRLLYR